MSTEILTKRSIWKYRINLCTIENTNAIFGANDSNEIWTYDLTKTILILHHYLIPNDLYTNAFT